jgi:hypothetical protein
MRVYRSQRDRMGTCFNGPPFRIAKFKKAS